MLYTYQPPAKEQQLYFAPRIAMASPPAAPASGNPPSREPVVRQLFQFASRTAIENIHVRPNGHLLLSTLNSGDLYTLDPAAAAPTAVVVASLPGSTALTGIATVDAEANLFAVGGGEHISFGFVKGSMAVYVIQIPADSSSGVILDRIPVDATLNGMTSLSATPYIVLGVDSVDGRVMRINTRTRAVDVPISDPSLGPGDSKFPIGVNGVEIRGDYLYFTNSAQGTFARIAIDVEGNKAGDVQVLATLPRLPGSMGNAYDDFTFDTHGNAYVAYHSYSFVKITPEGDQTVWVGSTENYTDVLEPMSAALSRDGKVVYLCTGGATVGTTVHGGQVLEVKI